MERKSARVATFLIAESHSGSPESDGKSVLGKSVFQIAGTAGIGRIGIVFGPLTVPYSVPAYCPRPRDTVLRRRRKTIKILSATIEIRAHVFARTIMSVSSETRRKKKKICYNCPCNWPESIAGGLDVTVRNEQHRKKRIVRDHRIYY